MEFSILVKADFASYNSACVFINLCVYKCIHLYKQFLWENIFLILSESHVKKYHIALLNLKFSHVTAFPVCGMTDVVFVITEHCFYFSNITANERR